MLDPNIVNRQPHLPVPQWASQFVNRLCDEYDMPIPNITWVECEADKEIGGWYAHDTKDIVIVAHPHGDYQADAHSIAHEFAHYITNMGHTPEMYAALVDITERMEMDEAYMVKVETYYKPVELVMGILRRF